MSIFFGRKGSSNFSSKAMIIIPGTFLLTGIQKQMKYLEAGIVMEKRLYSGPDSSK